ncbi:hypothetical protein VNO77_04058 [Canavalia gladiata]|uniref:tRNAHis guanylyltransferase catalytic domain-containing protein n=1 Tax=Canavalia gladiata TaxID=3824 RepID=A0AAN9MWJ4_CANGL
MANSKYEYVKCVELEKEVMFPNIFLVWINACTLLKPYDVNALKLMNSCVVAVLEEYAGVVLAYGFGNEYTFVFKKTSKFYERRASKVLSIITFIFSSVFVRKWGEFFPLKELKYPPYFHGMNEREAWDFNKGFENSDLNNLLFDEFNVNYNTLEPIVRQGSFEFDSKLMLSTWIVVRIDGFHFHRFSEIHEFVKPNDDRALKLMNSCAVAVLEEFQQDTVFAYRISDEYSFILKTTSNLYERRANKIISEIVSFFTSTYVMRWKDFFAQRELKYPPFDGRALVASGKSKREAQHNLKGAQLQKKIEELSIDYNKLPVRFRQGCSVFWDKVDDLLIHQENGECSDNYGKVIVEHVDIIGSTFWLEHPNILDEKLSLCALVLGFWLCLSKQPNQELI